MQKITIAMMIALAVVGGALALTTLYGQPAKATAAVRMDLSQLMIGAKNLPVAHRDDHSVVSN